MSKPTPHVKAEAGRRTPKATRRTLTRRAHAHVAQAHADVRSLRNFGPDGVLGAYPEGLTGPKDLRQTTRKTQFGASD